MLVAGVTLRAQALPADSIPLRGYRPGKLVLISGIQAAGYSAALVALNQAWYKDYPRSRFHFHNDLPDWFQQDKLGHVTATYHLSRLSAASFRWSGLDNRQSAWWGTVSGLGFLTAVEALDGFSLEWGASVSDLAANTLGAATFLSQQLLWDEQRAFIKYSYSESTLAGYRPGLLGSTLPQRMLKDYNGQTFWLSFNIRSWLNPGSNFPSWLNLAIGHGAYGMLGSRQNPAFYDGMPLPEMTRYRQWYLAPDIDFSRIRTGKPWLNSFLGVLNVLKMPSPAIEYNSALGWQFHWIFF